MAEAMKNPWDQFRWHAAFHDEGMHPHVHMVCYSADGKSGYLTKDGIARSKSEAGAGAGPTSEDETQGTDIPEPADEVPPVVKWIKRSGFNNAG